MEKIIIYGVPVYTNDKLKEKLKILLSKKGEPTSKELLIKLVDDNILIPVINEPNKLKQLLMKIRKKHPIYLHGMAGNGKAYVIFHPNTPSKNIIDTALHEILHVSHRQNPKKFNSLNMKLYEQFYTIYLQTLFKATTFDKGAFKDFMEKITDDEYIYSELYYKIMPDIVMDSSKFSHKIIEERVNAIGNFVWNKFDKGIFNPPNIYVGIPLRKAYRVLFKNVDYETGLGQELWNPAEIICVLSTINPDHPNVIKSLKLIQPGKKPVIKLAKKLIR